MALDTTNWKPCSLSEVVELFSGAAFPWWIAGGYAVELAIGRSFRAHGDIDVLVLRQHHQAVRELFAAWDCWASEGQLRPWPRGEILKLGIHDIWCRENPEGPWRLQIMLDESNETNWYSRRDSRVALPLAEFGNLSSGAIPYLKPEVIVFYKAKNPRSKDELDFTALLPVLSEAQRQWAAQSIRLTCGDQHPWLVLLEGD